MRRLLFQYSFRLSSGLPPVPSADKALQVLQAEFDALEVVFHALEFHCDVAVVAVLLQGLDALADLRFAVADDCAAEVVARSGLEPARAGIHVHAGFPVEVLRVDMEGVGGHDGDGQGGILVCAHEVAEVDQRAEVVVRDGVDELLDARGVLGLNNDLSAGVPEILQGITQKILPPLKGGWTTRRKSQHFAAYNQVASEFAAFLDIDEWQINPYFEQISGLNFQEREGEDALAEAVERVLAKIQAKYDEKGIQDKPFVIVKADAGTYGMGVMSVKSADEVRGLNRKNRNKMAKIKEGLEVSEVIVQEGIYTYETLNNAVCEPVVYMMDRFVIGGFFRVHEGRGNDENLNAGGMVFVPLKQSIPSAGSGTDSETQEHCKRIFEQWGELGIPRPCAGCPDSSVGNRLYVYGVMARLSLLAAAKELAD